MASHTPEARSLGGHSPAEFDAGYVPLDDRGFRLAMGLRPLELSQWLEVLSDGPAQIRLKRELLNTRFSDVVALRYESHPAYAELLGEIVTNLKQFHSSRSYSLNSDEHPLVAASSLVAEDLCVMIKENEQWVLGGAVVCFPSRWALADKIGTSLDEIHQPVPGYQTVLATPTRSFFERLTPQRSFWRLNWTLLDDATLFQPVAARRWFDEDPLNWQFRVERQTLRCLSESRAVVFTIRTSVRSAVDMVAHVPNFARDVVKFLRGAPDETLNYKGWVGLADRWETWFADVLSVSGTDPSPESSPN